MKFDSEYITNYILEYDIGIPLAMIIGVSLLVCAVVFILFQLKTSYPVFIRQASFCLFIGYVFLVLCTTIFFREDTYEKRYMLRPLWSYTVLYNKLLAQIIMNILLFIPIGLFIGGALKKKLLLNAMGIGFALSFFIELTQLVSTRGVFNIDDIIHNTLGCIIGYLCFFICFKLIRRAA